MYPDTTKYNETQATADLEAREVQWDYKSLVRRKGRLQRLK